MGGTIQQIGNGIKNWNNTVSGTITGALGNGAIGHTIGQAITAGPNADNAFWNVLDPNASVPGVSGNAPLQKLQSAQVQNAQQFSANLPYTQRQLASNLAQASTAQNQQQNRQINSFNSRRGLAYGGLNQGMQAANTAQNQSQLAGNISAMNANLQNASNTMTAQAIETGVGIQQTQQALQNQAYQSALANQQSSNSMATSLVSSGLLAAMLLA